MNPGVVRMLDPQSVEIGNRIMKKREEKGFSRTELAEKAEITPQFLALVETGRRGLSAKTVRGISLALEMSADSLLFGDSEHSPDNTDSSDSDEDDAKRKDALDALNNVAEYLKNYK